MSVSAKDCHTLTNYYLRVYEGRYGRRPVINRHKARWGFDSVLQDMSMAKAQELLDYYLETHSGHGHSLEWFFYHYDELTKKKREYEEDEAHREELREASRRRVEEWRKRQSANN